MTQKKDSSENAQIDKLKKDLSQLRSNWSQVRAWSALQVNAEPDKEVSISIRLSVDEHDLLKTAAACRGWKLSYLIRKASLERAVGIINTSKTTRFNMKGLAMRIAETLFQPRTHHIPKSELKGWVNEHLDELFGYTNERMSGERSGMFDGEYELPTFSTKVPALPLESFHELTLASRVGGAEFLELVRDYSDNLTAGQRDDVDLPVLPPASVSTETSNEGGRDDEAQD